MSFHQKLVEEDFFYGAKHAYVKAWMQTLPPDPEGFKGVPVCYLKGEKGSKDLESTMRKVRYYFQQFGQRVKFVVLCPFPCCKLCVREWDSVSDVDSASLLSMGSNFLEEERPTLKPYFKDEKETVTDKIKAAAKTVKEACSDVCDRFVGCLPCCYRPRGLDSW